MSGNRSEPDREPPAIDAAEEDELVLGLGRDREVVKVSLADGSPRIGLSMPAGGGKTAAARIIGAQIDYLSPDEETTP